MNIYDLTGQLLDIERMIDEGEIDDDVLLDTWESVDLVFEDKADGYAKIIQNFKADVEGLKAEEKRIADRRKVLENTIERMKNTLQFAMEQADKRKFKTELFSFNIQKNPAKVVIDDEAAIPKQYLIEQPPKIDRKVISDVLKAGGSFEWAHLEQGESLRIR